MSTTHYIHILPPEAVVREPDGFWEDPQTILLNPQFTVDINKTIGKSIQLLDDNYYNPQAYNHNIYEIWGRLYSLSGTILTPDSIQQVVSLYTAYCAFYSTVTTTPEQFRTLLESHPGMSFYIRTD